MADVVSILDAALARARAAQTRPPQLQEERVPMDIPASAAVHIQQGGVKVLRCRINGPPPRPWVYDLGQQVAPPGEPPAPGELGEPLNEMIYIILAIGVLLSLSLVALGYMYLPHG